MALTWFLALMLSVGFRIWGIHHPDPFAIRPLFIFGLLFVPSVLLGFWLFFDGFQEIDT